MTDARIPERYLMDRRVAKLSDAAFRTYILGTTWAVSNMTDGYITQDDFGLIPSSNPLVISELVDSGLWLAQERGGWLIADYEKTQTSRSELETLAKVRRRDREKKARQRAARLDTGTVPGDVPGDSPGDVSRRTAQDRTGEVRKEGKDVESYQGYDERAGELVDPEVVPWPESVQDSAHVPAFLGGTLLSDEPF